MVRAIWLVIAPRDPRDPPELWVARVEAASTAVRRITSPVTAPKAVPASVVREEARPEVTTATDAVSPVISPETAPTPKLRDLLVVEAETASVAASLDTLPETAPAPRWATRDLELPALATASSAVSLVISLETAALKQAAERKVKREGRDPYREHDLTPCY